MLHIKTYICNTHAHMKTETHHQHASAVKLNLLSLHIICAYFDQHFVALID